MLSNVKLTKNASRKKGECACVSIKLDNHRKGDQQPQSVDIECSSHPGFCVLDDSGQCTKRESAIHCAELSLKSLGETLLMQKNSDVLDCQKMNDKKVRAIGCNRKIHCYKIDLNNSQDTGLAADKQCQTCGPECSPATCSSRARQYFISWDKIRTKIFFFLALAFIVWLSVYSALSLTSNL